MYRIVARSADEIRRARDDWEAKSAANTESYNRSNKRYSDAVRGATGVLVGRVKDMLGEYANGLTINVNRSFGEGYELIIQNDELKLHDPGQALTWRYDVSVDDDGNIKKESSSWSGLNATTPESLADLNHTVQVLTAINNIDWTPIVKAVPPKFADYKEDAPYPDVSTRNRPDFESELLAASLEEVEGNPNKAIYAKPGTMNGQVGVYLFIERITPKFVTYVDVNDRQAETYGGIREAYENFKSMPERIKLEKLSSLLGNDFSVVDV